MTLKKIVYLMLFMLFSNFIFSQDSFDKNMAQGIEDYKNSKYIDCIYNMNLVLEKKSHLSSEALFWKAKSYYDLGYYNDAKINIELFFRKGSITTVYYEDIRFLYCKVFFKLGKYEDSLLLFNQFIRNKSFKFYSISAQFWIGECYLQLSDLDLAKKSFQNFLLSKPNNITAKQRITLIDRMLNIIDKQDKQELTVLDKASWFIDYVANEQSSLSDIDKKYFSNALKSIDTKEDFFAWIENSYINDDLNNNILLPDSTIIDTEEPIVVDDIVKEEESIISEEPDVIDESISLEESIIIDIPIVVDKIETEDVILSELELELLNMLGESN